MRTEREDSMDYSQVTESPGNLISPEALSMMYTRYEVAARHCGGKDVLEVGCGVGQGLGFLSARARRVVGGDYTPALLRAAQTHYGARIPLVRLDAHALPFPARSFDVVLLYEAIYYLAVPTAFLAECRRVLRAGGLLIVCSANREWSDFNPSPLSTRYFSATELRAALQEQGFDAEVFGAFPIAAETVRDRAVSFLKRAAVRLRLIPGTMKGKELLKRLFFGRLVPVPTELTNGMGEVGHLTALDGSGPAQTYKVLYATGRTRAA